MMALLTLLSSFALAGGPKAEVADTLAAFSTAVAAGDVAAATPFLHPKGVQVILMPSGPMTVDTEGYLGLMGAGKVGGHPIALSVNEVHVTGAVATASAVRRTGPYELTDAISLARGESGWQIVAMAVSVRELPAE